MNGAEAFRDWLEIALICGSIIVTAGMAIHRMTRMIVVMEIGFKINSKEHQEIIETQKCHSRIINRHERDIALLQQHSKDTPP